MKSADLIKKKRPTETAECHVNGVFISRRLKYLAQINPSVLSEDTDPDFELEYVDIGNVDASSGIQETESFSFSKAPSRARRLVKDGDTIVATVRTYLRAIATIENPPKNLVVSTGFAVLRAKPAVNSRFLGYALRSEAFVFKVIANSYGVSYPAINPSALGCLSIHLPTSPKHQQDIVAYLDRETRHIDTIIEKNRRLLELVDEKRTAFISHAVTRGYDPRSKPKPSGLTWLKVVPASWQVLPLKYALSLCEYGISESLSGNGHIKVLTMGEIQNGEVLMPDRGCLTEIAEDLIAQPGDLFFNRTNSRDLVGKVGLFRGAQDEVVTFASYLVRLRVNDKADPEYLNFLLNEYRFLNYIRGEAVLSINQANLSASRYSAQKIPLPPIDEQRAIVTRLKSQLASLDGIATKVTRAIDLLRERRLALISAAVTGKLEVPRS